jgi:glycosyltransferase involved in cell wall biosynthesis
MNKSPLVSVVMPVYNLQDYILDAINSIRAQTFTDFELIVIDNASTDATSKLIKQAAMEDCRIVILTNQKNIGVVGSLNRGLKESLGKYYARSDGDDIALPNRLAEQVAHMEENFTTVALSSWGEKFGDDSGRLITATTAASIRATSLFISPILHASSMIRMSALREHGITYRPNCPLEDFDIWVRLSRVGDLEALPKVLFKYRIHSASMTARSTSYIRGAIRVIHRDSLRGYFEQRGLGRLLNDFSLELHSRFSCHEKMTIFQYLFLPFWLLLLVAISGSWAYPKVVLKRSISYLRALARGRLLPQPEYIYKTHNEIEKLAM